MLDVDEDGQAVVVLYALSTILRMVEHKNIFFLIMKARHVRLKYTHSPSILESNFRSASTVKINTVDSRYLELAYLE